eukprot:gene4258-14369_t
MADVETELALANGMRKQLRASIPVELPQVHNTYFWDNPSEHPILYVDETLMVVSQSLKESISVVDWASMNPKTSGRAGIIVR